MEHTNLHTMMDQLCDCLQFDDHQGPSFAYQFRCCVVSELGVNKGGQTQGVVSS